MIELGVNIDHVATLREARKGAVPDVIAAAKVCEIAGAHQITVHLRQDRRHIQDRDVELLKQVLLIRLNLEMGVTDEIIEIAHRVKPESVCLVPENRREITTEGGLDAASQVPRLTDVAARFRDAGIKVNLFIDPDPHQVEASSKVKADAVEFHTGAYANARGDMVAEELRRVERAAIQAESSGLRVHAGHGLTVRNLAPIAQIPSLQEVNIGHDIIARAIFIGLEDAIREILEILEVHSL